MKPERRWLRGWASAAVLALAAVLLRRQLRGFDVVVLRHALQSIPPSSLALSLVATSLSFACLGAYERLATQWLAPGSVPRAVAWRTGLIAHALANTLGFHAVTAVALRLRTYRAHGIEAGTLGRIVAAVGACVAVGVAVVLAAAALWSDWRAGGRLEVFALPCAAFGITALLRNRLRGFLPGARILATTGTVFGLGLLEMVGAMSALVVLLPAGALPDGPAFVFLFVGATLLGVASHAPGGLGVFEAAMLAAAAPARRADVLAALVAYRAVYNLLPCALALLAASSGRISSTAGTRA